jgi:hypothetical protein
VKAAGFFVFAALALLLGGCDQLATARFYNLTQHPLTLATSSAVPAIEIAPGRSKRVVSSLILDHPLHLTVLNCRYVYRAISTADGDFDADLGVQSVLDVHPDLSISLRGWRGSPFHFTALQAQPAGWPLQPLFRTCR